MIKKNERPYSHYSLLRLKNLYQENPRNPHILSLIHDELGYRNSDFAQDLIQKIEWAIQKIDRDATQKEASFSFFEEEKPLSQKGAKKFNLLDKLLHFLPSFKAKKANEPAAILATWTAEEALSPQTYRNPEDLAAGDKKAVASLTRAQLPWENRESLPPKKRLYYQIILGSIPMQEATEKLIQLFGKDEETRQRIKEKSAIAAILVDDCGFLVEDNNVAISSFAWALPQALKGKLDILGAWPDIEPQVTEYLTTILQNNGTDGKKQPLDRGILEEAFQWITEQFGLPSDLIEAPSFALRIYHPLSSDKPPQATLLNSFFLGDLALARSLLQQGKANSGLSYYLGDKKAENIFNLLTDHDAVEKAVSPALMPIARWPSAGGHALVLLQQAAVNLTRDQLQEKDGIIAVNGPPGTGKTTLLRDVIAAAVVDRATAMAEFDDPEQAFIPTGKKITMGEKAFFHLYRLDPSIKGHEIIVASSNNKAVENISQELPAIEAIGRSTEELNYFRSISDQLLNPQSYFEKNNSADDKKTESNKSWGLIAAALGNAKNRHQFLQSFWWDQEYGFRNYLKAARGDKVVLPTRNPTTKQVIGEHQPAIVEAENPPSPQEAKTRWQKSRIHFKNLKNEIETELKDLHTVRHIVQEITKLRKPLTESETAFSHLQRLTTQAKDHHRYCFKQQAKAKAIHEGALENIARHQSEHPWIFARWFKTKGWEAWLQAYTRLELLASRAEIDEKLADQSYSEAAQSLEKLQSEYEAQKKQLEHLQRKLADYNNRIAPYRASLGDRIIDDSFFKKSHEEINLTSPWLPDSLHRKREDLFIAALNLHHAFIDASAQKFLHNLSIFIKIFSSGSPSNEDEKQYLGDLWSSLFMVVPVISTTFASTGRMLGNLPPNSIGWLLIDEAGQAVPQAAAGAIMRAKRSVVVGDPLQIPPVVSLPEQLTSKICQFFKVDKSIWSAPEASAQSLADQASNFQAVFNSDQDGRRVGIPLLVHRRCQNPMFEISNRIAYDNQMVHAAGNPSIGAIGKVIGRSRWLDVKGEADTKWCEAEGQVVIDFLEKLAAASITSPDLFIITPFRIVSSELKLRLSQKSSLLERLHIKNSEWIRSHIGTVHTFQGKEADSVILLLGAPANNQNGARRWAAETPNIFNVAVSRAKQNIYVIGSYDAWAKVGYTQDIAHSLPCNRSDNSPAA
ncbi:conserved hypothetical protein [Zymomonas mobilis subsp. mobilis NCIMB 11163]|uniref:DEAD/DEAH box helicase n=1 Tax=Zymomonas mobilis TaxID=542 RepID=UPI0001B70387|nr:AAA domain-containing protein [Zymomonas mobilis]ACV75121.1 conserved hypothetical protein [Zymomonas mobilis subsp. mobilis NCIMB 11163]